MACVNPQTSNYLGEAWGILKAVNGRVGVAGVMYGGAWGRGAAGAWRQVTLRCYIGEAGDRCGA